MIFYEILIFLIFIYGVRYTNNINHVPFDKRTTTCIKGVCAIYVLSHHIGQYIGLTGIAGSLNGYLGGVAVGVFFMLSAFGLVKSFLKKGNTFLKQVLLKNLPTIYLIYVVINICCYYALGFTSLPWKEALLKILGFDFLYSFNRINGNAWFITSIIIIYILFLIIYFVCSKLKNKNIAPITLSIIILTIYYLVKCNVINVPGLYIRAILCFILGILYATYFDKINFIINKYFKWFISLFSLLLIVGVLIGNEQSIALIVCGFIITFSNKFTYGNFITYFLGTISLPIYLIQIITMNLLRPQISNVDVYIFLCLVSTILFAFIFRTIESIIENGITKIYTKVIYKERTKFIAK